MKRPRKRWAWTARHKRPKFKNYWQSPDDGGWCLREAQRRHRTQTREALYRLRQGEDEANVVFPYHHHHWLKRWWD